MTNPAFQRAMILQQQHRYGDAADELKKVLAGDPHDATAHAMLALCLVETDELKQATSEAQQAVGLAPDLPLGHYALGCVLHRRHYLDEAKAAAMEAIRLDAFDPDHFALLAGIEFDQRHWPIALEQAEQGLALDPDHGWCTNLRAMALRQLGRQDEAAAAIGQSLSRDPENAVSHANQGWTLLHQGDHRQAMVHFKEALRLDPNLEFAKAGMVEAMKSSLFLYRWLLMFFLWMSRLSGRAQWGIIIGAYIGYRVLDTVARKNPDVAPFLWPILIAYIVFVVMTWLAYPLLNLVLRLHRYGRYALSRDQVVSSNWIGSMLLASIAALALAFATRTWPLLDVAAVVGLLIIPMAGAFGCARGWPRNVMLGIAASLAALGAAGIWLTFRGYRTDQPDTGADDLLTLFTFGILVSSFVTNALRNARPRS